MHKFERKDYGSWDVYKNSYHISELQERRRKLAKAANARLLRLERAKSDITEEHMIDSPYFDTVLGYLEMRGKRRFSESKNVKGYNTYQLKNEIVMLEGFLQAKSSTVTGYREIEEQRVQSMIKNKIPESVARDKEFYRFLVSETYEKINNLSLTSEKIQEAFSTALEDNPDSIEEILEAFEDYRHHQSEGWLGLKRRLAKIDKTESN